MLRVSSGWLSKVGFAAGIAMCSAEALSAEASSAAPVFGWLEKAIVVPVGATVKMKMDSGALTSSMDAKDIEVFKKDDERWVKFRLHLEDKETGEDVYRNLEMPVERIVRVRGAGGEDRRPVVELPICIGNKIYREEFSLRNRDNMLYPVLMGRRSLEQFGLLDVSQTFLTEPSCDSQDISEAESDIEDV